MKTTERDDTENNGDQPSFDGLLEAVDSIERHHERQRRIPYRGEAPFTKGSATSRAAAESIEPRKGRKQYEVLAYVRLCRSWGATADQIEAKCGIALNTVRPRLRELEEMGLITKSTMRRETRSGRLAVVYVAHEWGNHDNLDD